MLASIKADLIKDKLEFEITIVPADEAQHKLIQQYLKGDFQVANTSQGDHLTFKLAVSKKVKRAKVAPVELTSKGTPGPEEGADLGKGSGTV